MITLNLKTDTKQQHRDDSNYIVLYCSDSCQLILDVNSVHPNLHLSEGNRTATMKNEPKNYPDHPDRFDHWQQVRIYCPPGQFVAEKRKKIVNLV